MRILLYVLLMVCSNALSPIIAIAQDDMNALAYAKQTAYEERVTKIVKMYNPDAIVILDFDVQGQKIDLPLTPFTTDLSISSSSDLVKAVVLVVSEDPKLSPVAESLIKDALKFVSKDVKFVYRPMEASEVKKLRNNGYQKFFERFETLLQSIESGSFSWLVGENGKGLKWFNLGFVLFLIAVAIGPMLISGSILYQIRSRRSSMDKNAQKIVTALESGATSSSAPTASVLSNQITNERSSSHGDGQASASVSAVKGLSIDSLKALITDCYWCENDVFAAHLLRNMDFETKKSLYEGDARMRAYFKFLAGVPPQSGKYADDPYYLNPLKIEHLDNNVIAGSLNNFPELLGAISWMRSEYLKISAADRLQILVKSEKAGDKAISRQLDFSNFPESESRRLSSNLNVVPKSVADDSDLLANPELSNSWAARIPSLIWLQKIPDDKLAAILKDTSARHLAEAWTAPDDLLARMTTLMAPAKLTLLKQLLPKTTPSRQSEGYIKLWKASVEALEAVKEEATDSAPEVQNAKAS